MEIERRKVLNRLNDKIEMLNSISLSGIVDADVAKLALELMQDLKALYRLPDAPSSFS